MIERKESLNFKLMDATTTTTESLERSLQNCSLNNMTNLRSSSSNNSDEEQHKATLLELNSHISLPYQWEQCLDLKTGELYFINWSNGMKARQDPRTINNNNNNNNYVVDSDSEDEDDDCSYDSEEEEEEEEELSSSDSSCSTNRQQQPPLPYSSSTNYFGGYQVARGKEEEQVLVVAGCKSCFMYYMVPKLAADCPKCSGQLLHFDTSQNSSTTTS